MTGHQAAKGAVTTGGVTEDGVTERDTVGRVRARSADVALLAVSIIAAAVTHYRTYSTECVIVLACCVGALGWAVWRDAGWQRPHPVSVGLALLVAAGYQLYEPPHKNAVVTAWLWAGVWVSAAVTVLAVGLLALRGRWRGRLAGGLLGGLGLAYGLVIVGSPRALIDVWAILQGAALGFWHGLNPYQMTFDGVPPGQVNDCFNYLPVTFLAPAPARLLVGDVRYAEAAVLFAGVAALAWRAYRVRTAGSVALPLALLVGLLAGTLHDVQQAWNETLLVGLLVGAAVLADRGRTWWAVACVAVALATKQHVVVLLPLLALWPAFGWRRMVAAGLGGAALCLPWLLWDPPRFTGCTVGFFLHLPARADSLSVWQWLPVGLGTPILLLTAATAYALAATRLPRDGAGLLLGWGLVLGGWDLINKQSFLNQWLLVAQLVVAGLALAASRSRLSDDHRVVVARRDQQATITR
ncbi:MAG TPA: hypothetical protein VLJ59_04385 [Mycobacteriales bacterium]|nr:hypothetical protein [Mycobacteriales bacterium]